MYTLKSVYKWRLVVLVVGIVGGVCWWQTREPDFEYHQKWWKYVGPQVSLMKARLDTAKMATYVYGDSLMTIPYPDFFDVQERVDDDPEDPSVFFVHTTDSGVIYLRATAATNDDHWSMEQLADRLVQMGEDDYGDTILMEDMHEGYFYLKGEHCEDYGGETYYQQIIAEGDTCYMLSVNYTSRFKDEDVQRLTKLVHDWNPR